MLSVVSGSITDNWPLILIFPSTLILSGLFSIPAPINVPFIATRALMSVLLSIVARVLSLFSATCFVISTRLLCAIANMESGSLDNVATLSIALLTCVMAVLITFRESLKLTFLSAEDVSSYSATMLSTRLPAVKSSSLSLSLLISTSITSTNALIALSTAFVLVTVVPRLELASASAKVLIIVIT